MKSKGGALTYHPADPGAGFGDAQIRMVASHKESAERVSQQEELEMSDKGLQEQLDAMAAQLATAQDEKAELEAQVVDLTNRLDASAVENEALVTKANDLEAKLSESLGRSEELLEEVRREALKGTISDEDWSKQSGTIMSMSDEAFELMASTVKAAKSELPRKPIDVDSSGPEGGEDDKVKKLVL
jgi:chromosome segregation ATPase